MLGYDFHTGRKIYGLEIIETIFTTYGEPYSLYKQRGSGKYYMDASEGFSEVKEIHTVKEEEALEMFHSWIKVINSMQE